MPEATPLSPESAINQIRAAVSAKVHQTTLRAVSRAVGLSPSGLSHFIDGANPNPGTIRKLRTWYRRYGTLPMSVTPAEATASVLTLCGDLPTERQPVVSVQLLDVLRAAYGDAEPEWLAGLEEAVSEILGRSGGREDDAQQVR
jgi:hypothetical protein